MKTKFLILTAMCFSMLGFAQKNEIKAADKAVKSGDFAAAKAALGGAAGSIDAADAKLQAQYYFIDGQDKWRYGKKGRYGSHRRYFRLPT